MTAGSPVDNIGEQYPICRDCEKELTPDNWHLSYMAKGHKHCKECVAKVRLDYQNKHKQRDPLDYRAKQLLQNARKRAKAKSLEITIALQDIKEKLLACAGNCPCCKKPFATVKEVTEQNKDKMRSKGYKGGHAAPHSPTLDRLSNHLGYTAVNTVVLCHTCNQRKSDSSIADLTQLMEWLLKELVNKEIICKVVRRRNNRR